MFGLHMGRMGARAGGSTLAAKVAALFRSGEPGAWYDPSDLSTLFQDAAGTSPVTSVGQPVGRMLDKSGRGNTATQPTAINRPVLSARVNLLTKTEALNESVWNYATNGAAALDYQTINYPAAGRFGTATVFVGIPYVYSIEVKAGTKAGTVVFKDANNPSPTATATLSPVWQKLSFTYTPISGAYPTVENTEANSGTVLVRNASLVPASQASLPYQRVNTSADYDTVGFPHYLAFNGTNSWMQTASIDFTATDKMTVVAGVRKLSDAVRATVIELSSGVANGTFRIEAPSGAASQNYFFGSLGTTQGSVTAGGIAAPHTGVLTGLGNISGDSAVLRVNGVQVGASAADQGVSSYGNEPLYIGSRGGGTAFANINLYGLIVRGALSSDAQIASAERFMNSKTGAY